MNTLNELIWNAVANTGTVTSAAVDARFLCSATVQAKFTDNTAAGSLKLQGSNDSVSPANWNDVANSSATVASGALTTTPLLTPILCYQWIRAVFVSSGGAGTITAYLHANGD